MSKLGKFFKSDLGILIDTALGLFCLFTATTLFAYALGAVLIAIAARNIYERKRDGQLDTK